MLCRALCIAVTVQIVIQKIVFIFSKVILKTEVTATVAFKFKKIEINKIY